MKTIITEEVDSKSILESIVNMQLSEWVYNDTTDHHIGPFSDDFRMFGLGADPDRIETGDLSGILYACIKGLNSQNEELKKEISALNLKIDTL